MVNSPLIRPYLLGGGGSFGGGTLDSHDRKKENHPTKTTPRSSGRFGTMINRTLNPPMPLLTAWEHTRSLGKYFSGLEMSTSIRRAS